MRRMIQAEENQMHVHEVQDAVGDSDLPRIQRAIIWAMCSHRGRIDYQTGVYFGSKAELAARADVSTRALKTHIPKLIEAGWLIPELRTGQTTVYTLTTPCTRCTPRGECGAPGQTDTVHAVHHPPGATDSPPVVNAVHHPPGAAGSPPPVHTVHHTKNRQEDSKKEREEEVDAERARDLQRGEVAPSLSTTTTQQDGGTGQHRSRQEQQAPVQHATSATSQLYGSDGEELEQRYRDAIRDGYSDGGRLMGSMQVGHWQLIERALMEKWTPEQLRADVAANVRDYVQRRIAVRPHMLVQDMGSRAEHRDPNAPRSDMDVSRDRLMEIFKKEGWA